MDLSALLSMRFDAMCAVGVNAQGQPTSAQCAFLDRAASAGYVPLADLGRALDAPKYRKDNGCDPKASAEALEKYRQ